MVKYRILLTSRSNVCDLFLNFCLQTILCQPSSQSGGCPAELSIIQFERVTGKQPLKSEVLRNRKLGMLNIIEALELLPEVVYPIYTAACADSQESVLKKGEELLKTYASGVNLDDPNLISRLYLMFNGTIVSENIAPEFKVSLGNLSLRVRLMSTFCWSITAANSFPSTLLCIFGCIFGMDTIQVEAVGYGVYLLGLQTYATARGTRSFCFQAIGMQALRMPQLFRDKIDVAIRLLDALKLEAQNLRLINHYPRNDKFSRCCIPGCTLKGVKGCGVAFAAKFSNGTK